mmetsp:Transcript_25122/g.44591  ORF Transcript_25122/g.44591 Transcript_25122/m.44591 type:complete len:244 (-) Transcript_25122:9-740(-)
MPFRFAHTKSPSRGEAQMMPWDHEIPQNQLPEHHSSGVEESRGCAHHGNRHGSHGTKTAAGTGHCCIAIGIAGWHGVVCFAAGLVPHWDRLRGLVREAVRDQLENVAGHHGLHGVKVAVLDVAGAQHEALLDIARLHQVQGGGVLVPPCDVAVADAIAEVILPVVSLPGNNHLALDHGVDGPCGVIHGVGWHIWVVLLLPQHHSCAHKKASRQHCLGHLCAKRKKLRDTDCLAKCDGATGLRS